MLNFRTHSQTIQILIWKVISTKFFYDMYKLTINWILLGREIERDKLTMFSGRAVSSFNGKRKKETRAFLHKNVRRVVAVYLPSVHITNDP